MKQVKITYSPLGKAFEEQTKTIEEQRKTIKDEGEKQVTVIESNNTNEHAYENELLFPKEKKYLKTYTTKDLIK